MTLFSKKCILTKKGRIGGNCSQWSLPGRNCAFLCIRTTLETMDRERNTLPLADLRVTADGLAPQLGGPLKVCYTLLLLLLALLMLLAFVIYL